MPNRKWKYVNIPKAMWNEIEKLIEEEPHLGFTSVADFVTSAVRAHVHYRTNPKKSHPEKRKNPDT